MPIISLIRHPRLIGGLAACALSLWISPIYAQSTEANGNLVSGSVSFQLQNDWDYESDTATNERNNLYIKIAPSLTVRLPKIPGLSLIAGGSFEQVADTAPGEDRYFRDEGFYVSDLFLKYERGRYSFLGGKTNPGFGIAWEQAPGVFGADMAEDYEISDRIVLSASAAIGTEKAGKHSVTAGVFFQDTSFLQPTLFGRSRGTLGREDGGAGNTGDFSSFNVVLEGEKIPGLEGLAYHLAYMRQEQGDDGTTSENSVATGLTHTVTIGGGLTLNTMIEIVFIDDAGGIANTDKIYITPTAALEWEKWNLAAAWTSRETRVSGEADVDDWQLQFSAGYKFASRFSIDAGWKRLEEAGVATNSLGILLGYDLDF